MHMAAVTSVLSGLGDADASDVALRRAVSEKRAMGARRGWT